MDTVLKICVFLMMTAVGLGLTVDDFRRLRQRPWMVVIITASQWLLLPLAAWAIAWVLPLPPHLVAGMVLLAACPAGAVSNYYSYLARADVALSVSLTAISLVASTVTLPLVATTGFHLLLAEESRITVPVTAVAAQLALAVLLPVVIGMAIRHRFPTQAVRHERSIRRASEVVLFMTVVLFIIGMRHILLDHIGLTVVAAAAFITLAATIGLAMGRLLGADPRQRHAIAFEFGCRNTAITILVGMTALNRPELAVFGLVVFLTQIPLALSGIALATRWPRPGFYSDSS